MVDMYDTKDQFPKAYSLTYKQLRIAIESSPETKPRPIVDELYPETAHLPRVLVCQFCDLSVRHKSAISKALSEATAVPVEVLMDYNEFRNLAAE